MNNYLQRLMAEREMLEYSVEIYKHTEPSTPQREAMLKKYEIELEDINREIREECGMYVRHRVVEEADQQ